ncbi:MAG: AMP-binding protein [Kiritimatiellaeota bacterium]|nr:AMP-binding protein [Kiritimatiellota bacterium]
MKKNIATLLNESAAQWPDMKAVTFRNSSLTFAELDTLSNLYACGIRDSGVGPGVKTLMTVTPGLEFVAVVFAVFKTGAVPIFIDPGMGIANLANCVGKTEPEAMVGVPKAHWFRLFFPRTFKSVNKFFSVGKVAPPGVKYLPTAAEFKKNGGGIDFETVLLDPDDLAAIVFTTGSTGPPKGVVYTHRIYLEQTRIIKEVYGAGPNEIDMPAFPLFALFSAALGMPCVIPDINPSLPAKADPKLIVDTINRHSVSFSFASPALWRNVAKYCAENDLRIPTLKRALMAGAPAPPELHKALLATMAEDGDTFVPYGATEALPATTFRGSELDDETERDIADGRGYCLGAPNPGVSVDIIKPVDGPIPDWSEAEVLPVGEVGEIVVGAPFVTPEYHNLPEFTADAKIPSPDGLRHRMGDMGFIDDKGRLWFLGRKAHRVTTADGVLYPVCCEAVFNAHPNVARTALVGVGKPGSRIPVLIVEPAPAFAPTTQTEMDALVEELLDLGAAKDFTSRISRILFMPEFPVDIRHNAKIFREKLAVWAAKFDLDKANYRKKTE